MTQPQSKSTTALRNTADHDDVIELGPYAVAGRELRSVVPPRFLDVVHPGHLQGGLAEWDERSGVMINGPVGSGKTHQAAALCAKHYRSFYREWSELESPAYGIYRQHRELSIAWHNTSALMEQIRRSFSDPKAAPTGVDPATALLLVLDDLGAERPTDWVRERLYTLINHRYEQNLPTIVTTNLGLNDLAANIGQRSASRLSEMCQAYRLAGGDRRVRKPAADA